MARSGKTTFMRQLVSHTYESHIRGYVMNLDSAVMTLPFDANIDIRDTVRYKEVMKQINLGPNEGTLACESNKPIMIISNFRLSQSLGSERINLIMFSYTWILPVRLRYSLDPSLVLSSQKHLHPHFLL
ncbi:GPN-loop GTPase QQT2-like [Malus domestica]|uniref:GPN-loop GTPase QQT2-like n=1 Tax=Malus domestica TaxID=3750 RepID=UPI003976F0D6